MESSRGEAIVTVVCVPIVQSIAVVAESSWHQGMEFAFIYLLLNASSFFSQWKTLGWFLISFMTQ